MASRGLVCASRLIMRRAVRRSLLGASSSVLSFYPPRVRYFSRQRKQSRKPTKAVKDGKDEPTGSTATGKSDNDAAVAIKRVNRNEQMRPFPLTRYGGPNSLEDQRKAFNEEMRMKLSISKTLLELADEGKVDAARTELHRILNDYKKITNTRFFHNIFLKACAVAGDVKAAKLGFEELHKDQIANLKSYGKMMQAHRVADDLDGVLHWETLIDKAGLVGDTDTKNIVIDAALANGKKKLALERLKKMKEDGLKPNTTTYSIFMKFSESIEETERWYEILREESLKLDDIGYNILITKSRKNVEKVQYWFQQMCEAGYDPSEESYVGVFKAAAERANPKITKDLVAKWKRKTFSSPKMFHALMTALVESDLIEEARELVDELLASSTRGRLILSMNITPLVRAYVQNGESKKATGLYEELQSYRFKASTHFFNHIISVCKGVDEAKIWVGYMDKAKVQRDDNTYRQILSACRRDTSKKDTMKHQIKWLLEMKSKSGRLPHSKNMVELLEATLKKEDNTNLQYFDKILQLLRSHAKEFSPKSRIQVEDSLKPILKKADALRSKLSDQNNEPSAG